MRGVPKIKITSIAHHRNGVTGLGFFVVLFKLTDTDYQPSVRRNMMATCFFDYTNDGYLFSGNPRVAVMDVDLLAAGDVGFGINSFRGDRFARQMFDACMAWNELTWQEQRAGLLRKPVDVNL